MLKDTPQTREARNMSEEGGFGITAAEKFFGLILIIVGALATYFTLTSSDVLSVYTGFFGFLSIVLLALGIFLIIAKAE
jgi:preprotein translocase subunit SecY